MYAIFLGVVKCVNAYAIFLWICYLACIYIFYPTHVINFFFYTLQDVLVTIVNNEFN